MAVVLSFADTSATELAQAGGKASSLARLAQAGFDVPRGFVVTTRAYEDFVEANTLRAEIEKILATIDHADSGQLEAKAAAIRSRIVGAPVPDDLADHIRKAYRSIGSDEFVAVRSSGTAEDLADASFAGQHDSYLDIRGDDEVVDAVRRCWASLWTARAIAHREQQGFDHAEVRLAVVVQQMVASEVSGVMFTANPMSSAVDEIVINASWGLGEAIVSGVTTPDQFILDRETLQVKDRRLGSKAVQVIRDGSTRQGVVQVDVDGEGRNRFCLADDELSALGDLGRSVAAYYGDWPQDIEWALQDGRCYLLQSRDVTGVEFSWDEDLEDYTDLDRFPDDAVLSRGFSDEGWTGVITPLFYSIRADALTRLTNDTARLWGIEETSRCRVFKYHRGEAYYNPEIQYLSHVRLLPGILRTPLLLGWTPPSWFSKLQSEPESYLGFVKALARIRLLDPAHGFYRWFGDSYRQIEERAEEALGLPLDVIRAMSDRRLTRYVDETISRQKDWVEDLWSGFFVHVPAMTAAFSWMLQNWYSGTNPSVFSDLITGLPKPTVTLRENRRMWELAGQIRTSDELRALFENRRDGDFFTACEGLPAGREFLSNYRRFLGEFGHRGHADRDIWFPRRIEDPSIDYRTFSVFLTSHGPEPGSMEQQLIARREAATDEVLASIRKLPFGSLRAEIFKTAHDYLLRFFALRDDERDHTDRHTFAKKGALREVGRRLVERGVLDGDAFYYLSKNELFALLAGDTRKMRLTKAKVAGRRRNCERYRKEWSPPMYIHGNGTAASDSSPAATEHAEHGVLRGVGTSRGEVVGTARIVPSQQDLGRIKQGDILVTHSTDPGWTTVFLVISGLVLESGGMLAHGSCISREYGIPAVQATDAMSLIEDGSTISVNGDTGEVRLLAAPGEPVAAAAVSVAG